jgi:predicted TIM-barrel fold metal-dependent hydrolase
MARAGCNRRQLLGQSWAGALVISSLARFREGEPSGEPLAAARLVPRASSTIESPATGPRSGRQSAAKSPPAGGPYIDVHTHIGRVWNTYPRLSDDDLLRWMDDHNIRQAVVLPLVSPESSSYLNLTEPAIAAAKRHPDRLIAFCCIDPRTSYAGGRAGLRSMLQEYVDQGAKGFGEHKAGLPINDRKMMALYEACDDLRLPVLFHCDRERGMDSRGLPRLENVLRSFPNVAFIGHGPGFWASISGDVTDAELGGYPKGPVKPGGALDRLFGAYRNLWGDLSAGSGAGALARDRDFGRQFLIRRADRLLFGTDYLRPGQIVPQFELLASFDLPPAVRAKIERENSAKLLKLKEGQ